MRLPSLSPPHLLLLLLVLAAVTCDDVVTVTSPAAGSTFFWGIPFTVSWSLNFPAQQVKIGLCNPGCNFLPDYPNNGSAQVAFQESQDGTYQVK
jgi:hypothetical protein